LDDNLNDTHKLSPAVFLDRDGTINVDDGYIHRFEDIVWIPGAPEALGLLKKLGFKLIVITNQSGVARGYYKDDDVRRLHMVFEEEFRKLGISDADGTTISAYYHCPHHPQITGPCSCRKPSPGLILRGAKEWQIDLSRSYMVGDKLSDLEAGLNAKLKVILVRTGYGKILSSLPQGVREAEDVLAAARMIASDLKGTR
jgi:D-glycero-D-manno-heptose 1,7-bisphosphate phosphatase